MNQQKSEIIIVLDRSGSMASIKTDMEGGLKTLIESQRKDPGECLVSLYQFDTIFETVFELKSVHDIKDITLVPRDGTALHDAIGKTINIVGSRLKNTLESNRPGVVIFVVITDGEENSSTEFDGNKIKEMVKHQTDKYSWKFTFLGANQDAILAGSSLGNSTSASLTYAAGTRGVLNSLSSASANISCIKSAVYNGGAAGLATNFNYTVADREAAVEDDSALKAGNPLGKPSATVTQPSISP